MIGSTLKKIRKDKNIPIRLICEGIMDQGNYWRLENGEIDSSFSTVLKLLERMNMSIEEFMKEIGLGETLYQSYTDELVTFFKNKDIESLKQLKKTLANDLQTNSSMKLTHLYYLVDIYIFKIDSSWNAGQSKLEIKNYLAKCNNWNTYELALLNNVLFIYDLETSFLFYKMAVSKLSKTKTEKIIPLTLNVMALCIENDDEEKTLYVYSILEKIELNEKSTYERITQKWGLCIAQYYLLQDPNYLHEAEEMVDVFLKIGMDDTYNLYHSWTNSYKKIIQLT